MSRREYGRMKVWWQFVVGAACCLVVFGCTRNEGPDAGAEPETVPVETVKVAEREFAYNVKTETTQKKAYNRIYHDKGKNEIDYPRNRDTF